MKKFIAVLICFLMLLPLLSCKAIDDKNYNSTQNQSNTENTENINNTENKESAKETFNNENNSSALSESEKAMEAYEAVLKNKIKVYETDIKEYNYLKDCKTPYNGIALSDCAELKYAYTDIDNDSIKELVIDCGDTLILRYYQQIVYVYSFTFRSMYYLNTDGSYSWNHNRQNFEYGKSQIYFEGANLKARELYRIVNDGEPNAEYYIDGKQVSYEELQKYIENNPKTKVEFLPLENQISESEAINLAKAYWKNFNIEENGYQVEIGYNQSAPSYVHVIIIRMYVIDHYSTFDEIWIDKYTGETVINGKG